MAVVPVTYEVKRKVPGFMIKRPGFGNLVFSESSQEALDRPAAAKFAAEQGSPNDKFVLPSMRQEAAVRMEAEGAHLANNSRVVCNVEVYVQLPDGNFYRVTYDAQDSTNLILVPELAERVRDDHKNKGRFLGRRSDAEKDDKLSALVNHMITNGRKVSVPAKSPVEYSTNPNDTQAPFFGSAIGPVAELGDLAAPYATGFLLGEHGLERAYEWSLTEAELRKLGVDQDTFVILAGGLGVGGFDSFDDLGADDRFSSSGWARGVSQSAKISTGNEG